MANIRKVLEPFADLLQEDYPAITKLIAMQLMQGYDNLSDIGAALGISRQAVHKYVLDAKLLASKHEASCQLLVNQLSTIVDSRLTYGLQKDEKYAEYEIIKLNDTVDKLLKQLNKASEPHKSVGEKLALEVLPLNINVPTERKEKYNRGGKNFVAPTFDQVLAAFRELKAGLPELTLVYNADRFFNHYSLVNWSYGKTKTPLKKWRMAVGQWRIDDVPPNEISIYKAKLPKPPAPEPEPEFDPYKNLIPEVDHPLFTKLPESLQKLAYEANERFFYYEEETELAVADMLKNMKRTNAIEELRIKHQWHKLDQVRWWVRDGIYRLQNNLLTA